MTLAFGLFLMILGPLALFGWLWVSIAEVVRWVKTRRGVRVAGEILDTRVISTEHALSNSYFATVEWTGDLTPNTREFEIPRKWRGREVGEQVPLVVNPDRPEIAVIDHWRTNAGWVIAKGILGLGGTALSFVLGGHLVFDWSAETCPTAETGFSEGVCDVTDALLRSIRDLLRSIGDS